jgi:hypothetical protein
VLQKFDADGVHSVWEKALARRHTDPDGALMTARTLLETVCKRILDEAIEARKDALKPSPILLRSRRSLTRMTAARIRVRQDGPHALVYDRRGARLLGTVVHQREGWAFEARSWPDEVFVGEFRDRRDAAAAIVIATRKAR